MPPFISSKLPHKMKDTKEEYLSGSPLVHRMCEKHYGTPIDGTCEECKEFMCSTCIKEA